MAKDKKEQSGEEVKKEDLQIPEKPKKRGGDMKLIPLVGIIGGTVLFMILIVFSLYWFFIRPDIISSRGGKDSTKVQQTKELTPEEEKELKLKQEMAKLEEADALGEAEGVLFTQTQDIIANTNPPNYYVVIQLGLEFRLPEGEAKPSGGEGAAAAPTLSPKLMSEVSSYVTKFVGSRSLEQLSSLRDSLEIKFHSELKPIFIKNKVFLRKVSIPKFIMQSA
jgi:flagellar basal body-associated protein FliL